VIHFDYVRYFSSEHAEMRFIERTDWSSSKEAARDHIIKMAYNGSIILESKQYRYIQNGDYYLPCIKWSSRGENVYRIKTVMTWDMVKDRFQSVVDKYTIQT
jgi:hypothetical protein